MILTYEAVDAQGRQKSDIIEAGSAHEAAEMLRGQGLYVTDIQERRKVGKATGQAVVIDESRVRMPLKTIALFTRQMAMLLHAGSALVPAITAIKKQMSSAKHQAILGRLVADLEEGVSLTESLMRFPRIFDPVYCAIVSAGEASGALAEMFDRLAAIVQRRRTMRNKIVGALTYPSLLIVMSFKILLVLLLFVLPRFEQMFVQLAITPPMTTRWMLTAGTTLREYWPVLGLGAVAILGLLASLVFSDAGRRWAANIQLSIPLVGRLRSKLIQAQVFRTMGTLLNSRVGLLDTLDLARNTTSNHRFQRMFKLLEEAVTSGSDPSSAFEACRLVEPYICQAVRTGEQSGNLGPALIYCADILDETNTELVNGMARLLEPAILIGMGGVVGAVAVSLFLPLFEMTAAIR